MSDYDSKYFHHLLISVESKQQTIKSISNYMFHHREKHFHEIALIWKEVFFSLSEVTDSLILFYALNEVFLLSASKLKFEYLEVIGSEIASIIDYISLKCDDLNFLLKVNEIIQLWDNLMIFTSKYLNEARGPLIKKVSLLNYSILLVLY